LSLVCTDHYASTSLPVVSCQLPAKLIIIAFPAVACVITYRRPSVVHNLPIVRLRARYTLFTLLVCNTYYMLRKICPWTKKQATIYKLS